MKKMIVKANLKLNARGTKRFLKEIGEKYNSSAIEWDNVGCEINHDDDTIEFKINEDIYADVLAELLTREEIEITFSDSITLIKEVEEVKEDATEDTELTAVAKKLLATGHKVWEKGNMRRIYLNKITDIVSIEKLTSEYGVLNPKSYIKEIDRPHYDLATNSFEYRCNDKYKETIEKIMNAIEIELSK